jgi:hypothetical protein
MRGQNTPPPEARQEATQRTPEGKEWPSSIGCQVSSPVAGEAGRLWKKETP